MKDARPRRRRRARVAEKCISSNGLARNQGCNYSRLSPSRLIDAELGARSSRPRLSGLSLGLSLGRVIVMKKMNARGLARPHRYNSLKVHHSLTISLQYPYPSRSARARARSRTMQNAAWMRTVRGEISRVGGESIEDLFDNMNGRARGILACCFVVHSPPAILL